MAFNAGNLNLYSDNPNIVNSQTPKLWGYISLTDSKATVASAGYFDAFANFGSNTINLSYFSVNDQINCTCSDGVMVLQVIDLSPKILTQPFNSFLGPLYDGQLYIGTTTGFPTENTLTAGPGISIINGSGTIEISSSMAGYTWNISNSSPVNLVPENVYVANTNTLLLFNLPATAALGDTYRIEGYDTGGWKVIQQGIQQIIFGNVTTSVGAIGYIQSGYYTDSIEISCISPNTIFKVTKVFGNPSWA